MASLSHTAPTLETICSAGRVNSVEETAYLINESYQDSGNLVVQLCGSQPDKLYQASTALLDLFSANAAALPFGIDLNLGCPQQCAAKGGFGAYLVERDDELAIKCLRSMRRAIDEYSVGKDCKRPLLSAKIRLWDSGVDDTVAFVRRMKGAIDMIAIHCRTREEKHDGRADWEAGKRLAEELSRDGIPVILNGGVSNYRYAAKLLHQTNCHSIMVATGYLKNHRNFDPASKQPVSKCRPQNLATEYLDFCTKHPPPSYLYIQKHLRWIFRESLQPEDEEFNPQDYSDYRVRLVGTMKFTLQCRFFKTYHSFKWSFLVRPYLRSIYQYRLFVALFVKQSGGDKEDQPESIKHFIADVTYKSIKKAKLS